MSFSIIILAAGKGTRMNSKIPKVFHKVGNLPMIFHVLNASKLLKPKTISVVISNELIKYKNIIKKNSKNIKFAIQSKQLGTADAVRCALKEKHSINSNISLIVNLRLLSSSIRQIFKSSLSPIKFLIAFIR